MIALCFWWGKTGIFSKRLPHPVEKTTTIMDNGFKSACVGSIVPGVMVGNGK